MKKESKNKLGLVPKIKQGDTGNEYLSRKEGEKLIIQGTHVLYILDSTGLEIFNKINNQRTIKEIIRNLSLEYGLQEREIIDDVISFLDDLEKNDLIEYSNG